jgi:hypothetical protein
MAVLAAAACTGGPHPPSPHRSVAPVSRAERWSEDVTYLVERMEAIHPDLYHGVSRTTVHDAAEELVESVSGLDDDEVLVEVMRLVALISTNGRDGHMGVWPPDNPDLVHRYPLRLWEFPDGIHITAAREPNQDLVGARLTAIDGVPIEDVMARVDPVVPRDNDSNLRAARLVYLTSAEVLAGLGIARHAGAIDVQVTNPEGVTATGTVGAVDGATYQAWIDGWELALPERRDVLLLCDLERDFWIRYLPDARALYVQYNHVLPSSANVADAVRSGLRRHPVNRVVLDLRNNGGGEAEGYADLLNLLAGPEIDRPGRLAVLIGRLTFSAAASFAAELERLAPHAVFVGEPSGGAPNFWADTVTVTLPNSGVEALVSSTYEGYGAPGDPRMAIDPDVPVAFSWSDHAAGRDPVLAAAVVPAAG